MDRGGSPVFVTVKAALCAPKSGSYPSPMRMLECAATTEASRVLHGPLGSAAGGGGGERSCGSEGLGGGGRGGESDAGSSAYSIVMRARRALLESSHEADAGDSQPHVTEMSEDDVHSLSPARRSFTSRSSKRYELVMDDAIDTDTVLPCPMVMG